MTNDLKEDYKPISPEDLARCQIGKMSIPEYLGKFISEYSRIYEHVLKLQSTLDDCQNQIAFQEMQIKNIDSQIKDGYLIKKIKVESFVDDNVKCKTRKDKG